MSLAELQAELAAPEVNVLRLRRLIARDPGLVSQSGRRQQIWALLLGAEEMPSEEEEEDVSVPETPCEEQHVLEADCRRTRTEEESFRTLDYRKALQAIIQTLCLFHNAAYRQGINEIAAPFIALCPPPRTKRAYVLLEAAIARYSERLVLSEDSQYLFRAFRMLELLFLYHDPLLARHLAVNDFPPELFCPQWFLTLFSRGVPLKQVLRIWDHLFSIDDPAFQFFIAHRLISSPDHRSALLGATSDRLPDIISHVTAFGSDEEVDRVMSDAFALMQRTPRSFIRNLRLTLVSTADLNPSASAQRVRMSNNNKNLRGYAASRLQSENLAMQAARSCVLLSPREVQLRLSTIDSGDKPEGGDGLPVIVIDTRSVAERKLTGCGGSIVGSIEIDYGDCSSDESGMKAWLAEHLENFKGVSEIIILDQPVVKVTNLALVKRLLFGEGDGVSSANVFYTSASGSNQQQQQQWSQRDRGGGSSQFSKSEAEAADDDASRPGVSLARLLQQHGYKYVSLGDGGVPGLVDQLLAAHGSVNGYLTEFNETKWHKWRSSAAGQIIKAKKVGEDADENGGEEAATTQDQSVRQQLAAMTDASKEELAIAVASRLGHNSMLFELQARKGRE